VARKNSLKKTTRKNIYEHINNDNHIEYLATWTQNGRRYIEKNLTKLYGVTTLTKASEKLEEIKVLIRRNEDPFRVDESDEFRCIRDLVLDEIKSRDASDNYKYIQKKSFLKHLDPHIGKLKLKDLTIEKMVKVFTRLKKSESKDTISNLKKTIRPILEYAVDEGIITRNPLNSSRVKKLTKTSRKSGKAPLKHRLLGDEDSRYLNASRALYQGALNFKKNSDYNSDPKKISDRELQIVFLMAIMTARRRSEILSIKYEDITSYNTVKVRAETTKTSVWEEYPLPQEVLDRLIPEGTGKIAPNISKEIYSTYMRKLIDGANLHLHSEMKFDGHDTRHLFLTIMSKKTKNPFLCDAALSHNKDNYKILLTYYEPDISDFKELFNLYWSLLRGNEIKNETIDVNNSNTSLQ
jgi:integrase